MLLNINSLHIFKTLSRHLQKEEIAIYVTCFIECNECNFSRNPQNNTSYTKWNFLACFCNFAMKCLILIQLWNQWFYKCNQVNSLFKFSEWKNREHPTFYHSWKTKQWLWLTSLWNWETRKMLSTKTRKFRLLISKEKRTKIIDVRESLFTVEKRAQFEKEYWYQEVGTLT